MRRRILIETKAINISKIRTSFLKKKSSSNFSQQKKIIQKQLLTIDDFSPCKTLPTHELFISTAVSKASFKNSAFVNLKTISRMKKKTSNVTTRDKRIFYAYSSENCELNGVESFHSCCHLPWIDILIPIISLKYSFWNAKKRFLWVSRCKKTPKSSATCNPKIN